MFRAAMAAAERVRWLGYVRVATIIGWEDVPDLNCETRPDQ